MGPHLVHVIVLCVPSWQLLAWVADVVEAVHLEPARLGEEVVDALALDGEVGVEAGVLGVRGAKALQQPGGVVVLHVAK
eukprot:6178905-Pleurochrysis_carterae.AAC.2